MMSVMGILQQLTLLAKTLPRSLLAFHRFRCRLTPRESSLPFGPLNLERC
jgi:hypothetical protein